MDNGEIAGLVMALMFIGLLVWVMVKDPGFLKGDDDEDDDIFHPGAST